MQKRHYYTQVGDFLADRSFQLWILSGTDEQGWEEWTLENQDRAKLVEKARLLMLAMKVNQDTLSKDEIRSALESTWGLIKQKEDINHFKSKKSLRKKYSMTAAASVLFCFLSVWLYNSSVIQTDGSVTYNKLIKTTEEGLVEQTNNSDKPQIIVLSDGSSILLQPKSKLSYPKIFTGNVRKVYLSGEGFFEISKNPHKPFLVYANEIITKVVGTSFRVKAFSDQPNVEVLVRTGKVKVISNESISNSTKEQVVLLPNQALRFVRREQSFSKITDITGDKKLTESRGSIEQLSFEFTDIPVTQIFKTIEQAYLVDIDFPENKLKDCYLTSSLTDQPLSEKLRIICKSIGNDTNFEMNGGQIVINSEGCN
jgi:transmembrane sensor